MARKGRNFEIDYKWLYDLDKNKYKVESPAFITDKVTGSKREIDVLVQYYDDEGYLRKMAIECRDRKEKENVMWIEQLKTKKEDLELDCIIATTTCNFSASAIKKARHHGIIIEKAEIFSKNRIDEMVHKFYIDLFYLKYELIKFNFIDNKNTIRTFKDIFSNLSFSLQNELINEINGNYFFSIDPIKIMEDKKFDKKMFYDNPKNSDINIVHDFFIDKNSPNIYKKLNIKHVFIQARLVPFKLSLPLNKSVSVFEVEENKNKKYKAVFGDIDEEFVEYGFLDDNKIYNKMKLKERKYHRLVNFEMRINTIFPNIEKNMTIDTEEWINKGIGSFDFSKIK